MAKVEIQGLEKIKAAFNNVPSDMRPYVLRDIARPHATKAATTARHLQPIGDTGATAKTIGIIRVRNQKQPFVEVGYRGRSLGHIYTSADTISRDKRGTIKGFPRLFKSAGEVIDKLQMKKDIKKLFARSLKKRGVGR